MSGTFHVEHSRHSEHRERQERSTWNVRALGRNQLERSTWNVVPKATKSILTRRGKSGLAACSESGLRFARFVVDRNPPSEHETLRTGTRCVSSKGRHTTHRRRGVETLPPRAALARAWIFIQRSANSTPAGSRDESVGQ